MARLFVLSGNSIGATFDLIGTSTVGRGDKADIVIPEASISREHARLVPRAEPGHWKVVDLNSSNGLFLGGKRVKSGVIGDGDTFRLGEIELRLRDDAAPEEDSEEDDDLAFEDEPLAEVAEEGEFELEFGEDLDEQLGKAVQKTASDSEVGAAPAASRTRSPSAPKAESAAAGSSAAGTRAGARATEQRSQRRQEALKGGSVAARAAVGAQANPSGGGRPVLQYASANHRSSGADLAQMSSAQRALLILLGVAVMGGIAYGAFTLTRTARSQSSVLAD